MERERDEAPRDDGVRRGALAEPLPCFDELDEECVTAVAVAAVAMGAAPPALVKLTILRRGDSGERARADDELTRRGERAACACDENDVERLRRPGESPKAVEAAS